MSPYFFGSSERPLFGLYGPPLAEPAADAGVLLCYPAGQEYMRSHWTFRQLAQRLQRAGLHTFRFDYTGTGDSAGGMEDAGVDVWCEDIRLAAEEFRDTSGIRELGVVGLRLGADLALKASTAGIGASHLVLWDPVVDGNAYLDRLTAMHEAMLRDRDRFGSASPRSPAGGPYREQLLGFPFPDPVRADIRRIDTAAEDPAAVPATSLVLGAEHPGADVLEQRLLAAGRLRGRHDLGGRSDWDDLGAINNTFLAPEAVDAVCRAMGADQ